MKTKEAIQAHLFEMYRRMILDFQSKIEIVHSGVDLDEEDTMDPEDFSHQSESSRMEQIMRAKLEQAESEFNALQKIDFSVKQTVEPGTLIETNQFNFIVSCATLPFQIDGKQFIGISTDSPIYSIFKEKKPGDQFEFNHIEYHIHAIY